PDGWMPNPNRAPHAPLVICTGAGPMIVGERPGHPPGKPHGPDHGPDHGPACAFAGLGAAPPPPPLLLQTPPVPAEMGRADAPSQQARLWNARYREQSARGPPLRV